MLDVSLSPCRRRTHRRALYSMDRSRRPEDIPERLLARLWRNRDWRRRSLPLADGKRLRVLYPGRPGGGPGPDFRDAILQVEGRAPVRGDVAPKLAPSVVFRSSMETPRLRALSRSVSAKSCGTFELKVVIALAISGRCRAAPMNLQACSSRYPALQ